jgi:hypothetical protein
MNPPSTNGDENLVDEQMLGLRDCAPNALVESRLQLRMRNHWEALSETVRETERSPNIYRIWLALGTAAALLFSAAILLLPHREQVADGSRRDDLKSIGTTVEFKSVVSKDTDPCNILPPLPDWRS